MSEREYVRALNEEIAKLNMIIDRKILHHHDYRREARKHKILLAQIRRNEARRSLGRLWDRFFPIWG
jgi:hypothetical protein